MADYIRVEILCQSLQGRLVTSCKLDIRSLRKVLTLTSYLKEIWGWEGTLWFGPINLHLKKRSTLFEIGIKNRDILHLKRFVKRTLPPVQEFTVRTAPDQQHQLEVPVNCTVESLKVHIECSEKIIMERQCFECGSRRMVDDLKHKISKEELAQLVVTDILQGNPNPPSQYPTTVIKLLSPPHKKEKTG